MQSFLEYANGRSFEKKKLDKIGDYTIFIVNASAIRNHDQGDDEFNHLATHLDFPKLVPNKEIWISRDIAKEERLFLITNGINQYEGKEKGKKWYAYALKKEKAEREKMTGKKLDTYKMPPKNIYYKYYCGIPSPNDDVEVWLVNGELVRDLYKTDFCEAGNGLVYGWMPKHHIWVEKNLLQEEGEVDIMILHEYVESTLMKLKKMSYERAHTIASKVCLHHRGKWDITDVKALDREEALELVKKYL